MTKYSYPDLTPREQDIHKEAYRLGKQEGKSEGKQVAYSNAIMVILLIGVIKMVVDMVTK